MARSANRQLKQTIRQLLTQLNQGQPKRVSTTLRAHIMRRYVQRSVHRVTLDKILRALRVVETKTTKTNVGVFRNMLGVLKSHDATYVAPNNHATWVPHPTNGEGLKDAQMDVWNMDKGAAGHRRLYGYRFGSTSRVWNLLAHDYQRVYLRDEIILRECDVIVANEPHADIKTHIRELKHLILWA